MKHFKKKMILMIFGMALSLASASAMAAEITWDKPLSVSGSSTETFFQQNLLSSLAQFDTSKGTLTGVNIILTGTYTSLLTASNNYFQDKTITWGRVPYTLAIDQSGDRNIVNLDANFSTWTSTTLLKAGAQNVEIPADDLSVNKTYTFDGDKLGAFKGDGFVDFYFGALSLEIINPIDWYNSVRTTLSSTFTGSIKTTYSYTPAPLPSALLFLISGLLGLAGFKKFRKRTGLNG